jgi:hypothetical protein
MRNRHIWSKWNILWKFFFWLIFWGILSNMKGLILILQSRNCSKIKCKWNWLLWPLLGCIWTKIHAWQWSTTLTILNLEFHKTCFINKLTFRFPWIIFATCEECFESTFCLLAKFHQKVNLKIQNSKMKWFWRCSIWKNEGTKL